MPAGFGSAIVIVAVWTVCQTCGLDAGEGVYIMNCDCLPLPRLQALTASGFACVVKQLHKTITSWFLLRMAD